jgi:hypothetical protein
MLPGGGCATIRRTGVGRLRGGNCGELRGRWGQTKLISGSGGAAGSDSHRFTAPRAIRQGSLSFSVHRRTQRAFNRGRESSWASVFSSGQQATITGSTWPVCIVRHVSLDTPFGRLSSADTNLNESRLGAITVNPQPNCRARSRAHATASCGAPIFRSGSSEHQMQAGLGKIATDCL